MSLAQAEAIVGAARSFVVEGLTRLWDALCDMPIARVRLSITHAIHDSVRAVDVAFHAAGTNAIYTANPRERHFRDIHVAVQHVQAHKTMYEQAGKALLGIRPTEPGW